MPLRFPLLVASLAALVILGAGVAAAAINRGVANPITWLEAPSHEPGSAVPAAFSTQQRGYYSITTQLHTSGLTPGHRYTIWWVIFNQPASCQDGCDANDLVSVLESGENPAGIGFHYGGSFVAVANGKLQSGTRILEHATIGCQTAPPFNGLCNPVIDAAIAEATVLLNDHGPATDDPLPPATNLFSYGCKTYSLQGKVLATYGQTGYDCVSVQTTHLP